MDRREGSVNGRKDYGFNHKRVNSERLSTRSWLKNDHLRMRVTSHIKDDVMNVAMELGGIGLAKIVASTSSHTIWVSRLGIRMRRGNVDLAIRTTMRASGD